MAGLQDCNPCYFVGVDVGTSSVRAALVNNTGHVVKTAVQPVHIWEPQPDFYEQSSEEIWAACCMAVKDVASAVDKGTIKGLGFDGTCSLVVLDKQGQPITASPTGNKNQNIIMWMDHRAKDQANRINKTNHKVLKYTGGSVSLEMETPKLLWLKESLKTTWTNAGMFIELPDYMTWRATGSSSRSLGCLVSKWTYQASNNSANNGWDDSYFTEIGLEDLVTEKYNRIGVTALSPGEPSGTGDTVGLSEEAAVQLNLLPGTAVGTSILDAHAGCLGSIGCKDQEGYSASTPLESRMSLVCGTSTCHMTVHTSGIFIPGVWGPNFSAAVPGMWTNEGGQSATGKLVDHIVETHVAYEVAKKNAKERGQHIHIYLNSVLQEQAEKQGTNIAELTKNLHVYPDFHGNRSPWADSSLTGMISGLTLSTGLENLALLYLATVQALAYGTRDIIEAFNGAGYNLQVLYACGGLSKNQLYVQTHADATGYPIIIPNESECVLLGAAMLGACASGKFATVQEAIEKMSSPGTLTKPNTSVKRYHEKKFAIYTKMREQQLDYRDLMEKD